VLYRKKEVSTKKFPNEKERHTKSDKLERQGEQVCLSQVINNSVKHLIFGLVLYQMLYYTLYFWLIKGCNSKSTVSTCLGV